jgi:small subunit ribosomal protein S3
MGQKVHPKSYRLTQTATWSSKWFSMRPRNFRTFVQEDIRLREHIRRKLRQAYITEIEIERTPRELHITIHTARPALVIGRGGAGIETLREELKELLLKPTNIRITVQDVRRPDLSAAAIAQSIADQLEKRLSFRRAARQAVSRAMQAGAQGVKVALSGRLGGKEMSRTEWLAEGSLPLQTVRERIDFARATAYTTYGTIGVKVWVYYGPAEEGEEQEGLPRG